MRLAGAYRSLPRPSSAAEPRDPPRCVCVSSIIGTLAGLGLANVSSLCARVARTIEGRGLKISPEGLIRTPRPQQPR